MKWNAVTRRHFLQGSGKAALALPVLQSLLPKSAEGQTAQKTFIGFPMMNHISDGYNMSAAEGTTTPATYMPRWTNMTTFAGPMHQIQYKTLDAAKTDGGGQVSEYLGAEFNPYLSKMLLMLGFDWPVYPSDHHHGHFGNFGADVSATSAENGVSHATIDQVMAYSTNFYKNPALLGRSVHWTGFHETLDYFNFAATFTDPKNKLTTPISRKPAIMDPDALWDSYFKGFMAPTGMQPPPGPTLKSLLVDQVLTDYKTVRGNSRLGKADKAVIDQHVAMLHQTETAVKAAPIKSANCTVPPRQATLADRKANYQAMNSVVVALAACGLVHSFIGSAMAFITASGDDWHSWSHGNASNPTVNLHDQNKGVLRDVVLDLVKKLDQAGLLATSLVFVPQEHARVGHNGLSTNAVIFGDAGGALKTGQYIDFRNMASGTGTDNRHGYLVNQLFANVLMAMDVPPSEFEALNRNSNAAFTPGNSGYGSTQFYGGGTAQYARFKGHSLSDWMPLVKA